MNEQPALVRTTAAGDIREAILRPAIHPPAARSRRLAVAHTPPEPAQPGLGAGQWQTAGRGRLFKQRFEFLDHERQTPVALSGSSQQAGIRALHMVGAPMDKKASPVHLPQDLERLATNWNGSDDGDLVRVGLFGQFDLQAWRVARRLGLRILSEFIGDLAKLGSEFGEKGVLGTDNIFNHCTRIPTEVWKLFADTGVKVTVNPRSDALFGFDDDSFAYQQAIDHGLTPALGIDLDTAFGSDLFGEMHALFSQQRSAMRYRKFRVENGVAAPISVEAVLKAATVNGARAAGLERSIGTLTPGKQGARQYYFHIVQFYKLNMDILVFEGLNEHGKPQRLVQHVTQLSILLTALPKLSKTPRRIGFHNQNHPPKRSPLERLIMCIVENVRAEGLSATGHPLPSSADTGRHIERTPENS